jgi:GDP-4-dehydro-6-deoxy-D-mannose reductase
LTPISPVTAQGRVAEAMAPRRILITGAAGFVGRHLQTALARACPDAVLATAPFDVRDASAVQEAVRAAAPDACVHLAGVTSVGQARAEPEQAWLVNLHGTLNVARAVLAEAPACRFLYVSTSEVYGASFRAGHAVDETVALAPMNTYAATKAAADLAVGAMVGEGLRAIRVRPFNHTGPGQTDAFVVPSFARQLMRIRAGLQPPVMHVGALDPARDFLDVRDVCAAYVACLTATDESLPSGTILNIASGIPRRIGDVLDAMREIAGVEVTVETEAGRLRPSDIPVACGDASLALARLGWVAAIPWEVTLRDVLDDWGARVAADGGG